MPENTIDCPRCNIALHKKMIQEQNHSIEIDECSQCKGNWFDAKELQVFDQIVEPVLLEFRGIPNEYDQLTALYCPDCKEKHLLEKHEHPRDSKVIIDVCQHCKGIWLDGGELRAIQQQSLISLLFGL